MNHFMLSCVDTEIGVFVNISIQFYKFDVQFDISTMSKHHAFIHWKLYKAIKVLYVLIFFSNQKHVESKK